MRIISSQPLAIEIHIENVDGVKQTVQITKGVNELPEGYFLPDEFFDTYSTFLMQVDESNGATSKLTRKAPIAASPAAVVSASPAAAAPAAKEK